MEIPFDHFSCSFVEGVPTKSHHSFHGASVPVLAERHRPCSPSSSAGTASSSIPHMSWTPAPAAVPGAARPSPADCGRSTSTITSSPSSSPSSSSPSASGAVAAGVVRGEGGSVAAVTEGACLHLLDIPLRYCAATFVFDALLIQQLAAWRRSLFQQEQHTFRGCRLLQRKEAATALHGSERVPTLPRALVYVQPTSGQPHPHKATSPPAASAGSLPALSAASYAALSGDIQPASPAAAAPCAAAPGVAAASGAAVRSPPRVNTSALTTAAVSVPSSHADSCPKQQATFVRSTAAEDCNTVAKRGAIMSTTDRRSGPVYDSHTPRSGSSSSDSNSSGSAAIGIGRDLTKYGSSTTADDRQSFSGRQGAPPVVSPASSEIAGTPAAARSRGPALNAAPRARANAASSPETTVQGPADSVLPEPAAQSAAATVAPATRAAPSEAALTAAICTAATTADLREEGKEATAVLAATAVAPTAAPTSAAAPTAAAAATPTAAGLPCGVPEWRRRLRGGCWMRTSSRTVPLLLHLSSRIDLLGNRSAAAQRIHKEPMTSLAKLEAASSGRAAQGNRTCCRCCCCLQRTAATASPAAAVPLLQPQCALPPSFHADGSRDKSSGSGNKGAHYNNALTVSNSSVKCHSLGGRRTSSSSSIEDKSSSSRNESARLVCGSSSSRRSDGDEKQSVFSAPRPLVRPQGGGCGRCRCCSGSWRLYIHVEAGLLRGFCKLGRRTLWLSSSSRRSDSSCGRGRIRSLGVPNDADVGGGCMQEVCCAPVLLDFYVCESCQREGYGSRLFAAALLGEKWTAQQIAYDRPSPMLLAFLQKNYSLSSPHLHPNNFVTFPHCPSNCTARALPSAAAGALPENCPCGKAAAEQGPNEAAPAAGGVPPSGGTYGGSTAVQQIPRSTVYGCSLVLRTSRQQQQQRRQEPQQGTTQQQQQRGVLLGQEHQEASLHRQLHHSLSLQQRQQQNLEAAAAQHGTLPLLQQHQATMKQERQQHGALSHRGSTRLF